MAIGSFNNPITGADGALVINQIKSPNFTQNPLEGWAILKDGSSFFSNVTISGTFMGNDWIMNSSGLFFYNGTPAFGNLVGSWASVAGTDTFGNPYAEGICIGVTSNTEIQIRPDLDAILIYAS